MIYSIQVKREYLNKTACLKEARRLIFEEGLCRMSEMQAAREIYFHAAVFYFCERTGLFPGFKEHADPIDLCDGGDTPFRKVCFYVCWILRKSDDR